MAADYGAPTTNFNPRPPRGGRQRYPVSDRRRVPISIHALREEGDMPPPPQSGRGIVFQSTPSARRATWQALPSAWTWKISIHALREEGDLSERAADALGTLISIHALREEGDLGVSRRSRAELISIHALREEGDPLLCRCSGVRWRFQSTPSARRATYRGVCQGAGQQDFNPRPPRGGRPHPAA